MFDLIKHCKPENRSSFVILLSACGIQIIIHENLSSIVHWRPRWIYELHKAPCPKKGKKMDANWIFILYKSYSDVEVDSNQHLLSND